LFFITNKKINYNFFFFFITKIKKKTYLFFNYKKNTKMRPRQRWSGQNCNRK